MYMITGDGLTENDRYGDEVLNASWLPSVDLEVPEVLEEIRRTHRQTRQTHCFGSDRDAEDFMQMLYRSQE